MNYEELVQAKKKYQAQKNMCKRRKDRLGNDIEMRLSFEEWLFIWLESGKWEHRGKCIGQYCMSRLNDIGHYEQGNVVIRRVEDNSREAIAYSAPKKKKQPKFMHLQDDFRACYLSGSTFEEIGSKFGCSATTVRRVLTNAYETHNI